MRQAADEARSRAELDSKRATETCNFLRRDLLGMARPSQSPRRDVTVRELLDLASEKVDGRFDEYPVVECQLRCTLASVYLGLYEFESAEAHILRALELEGHEDVEDEIRLSIRQCYGEILLHTDRLSESEKVLCEARDFSIAAFGESHELTVQVGHVLSCLYIQQARYAEAEKMLRAELDHNRDTAGERAQRTAKVMATLARVFTKQGRLAEAEPLLHTAIDIYVEKRGESCAITNSTMCLLRSLFIAQHRYKEAEKLGERILRATEQLYEPDSPAIANCKHELGYIKRQVGKYDEAQSLLEAALSVRRDVYGPSTFVATTLGELAGLHRVQGRVDLAMQRYKEALEMTRALEHTEREVAITSCNLAMLYLQQESYDESEALIREALPILEELHGADHEYTLIAESQLGRIALARGKYEQARRVLASVSKRGEAKFGAGHLSVMKFLRDHARSLCGLGRPGEAEEELMKAYRAGSDKHGRSHPTTRLIMRSLIELYDQTKREKRADKLRKLLARFETESKK
jgi:tetratricopeptide (TPR) repeat protein